MLNLMGMGCVVKRLWLQLIVPELWELEASPCKGCSRWNHKMVCWNKGVQNFMEMWTITYIIVNVTNHVHMGCLPLALGHKEQTVDSGRPHM
jgi:hypothetical protein